MITKSIPDCVKGRIVYDPEKGTFIWKYKNKMHPKLYGKNAGTIRDGYLVIKINGSAFRAHRIALFLMTGEQPAMIDHINGNKSDNRFSNLRACNNMQNTQNHLKKINKSGLPAGVRNNPSGRYSARITVNKKVRAIGTFDTIEEAENAYLDARKTFHDAPCLGD